jgi:hypothetical protein
MAGFQRPLTVRLILAQRSHELLEQYRHGEAVGEDRPLKKALN